MTRVSDLQRGGSRPAGWSLGAAAVLAVALLAAGLLMTAREAIAAPVAVAGGTLTVCNGEQNAPGEGVRCTVTVTNYVTATGALAVTPASSWTVTRCTGAAGVLSPALLPAATCTTTTTPIVGAPVTTVQQCNGAGNGGGGGVWCTVTVTNHFTPAPVGAFTPASVYECVSVPLTPGLLCDPTSLANTAGSVPAATIGQCNGSGNGGGLVPAVPGGSANCSVGAGSTTTVTMVSHVDQCNGSANGGGAFLKCSATVINDVVAPIIVPIVWPEVDQGNYPPVVITVVPSAGAAPTPTTTPPVVVVPVVIVPPGPTPVTVPPVAVPPGTAQILVPVIVPPGVTPIIVPQVVAPRPPRPAPTGTAGPSDGGGTPFTTVLLLGFVALALTFGGRALIGERQR